VEPILIRELELRDLPDLLSLLDETRVFRPDELDVAREVLEAAANRGEASGYVCAVAQVDDSVAGFTCYGATPCTVGTFDLYWLAVHPRFQGKGIASKLVDTAEAGTLARGGRLLVVETSDTAAYDPARRFYEAKGYAATARIPEFYRPGDAKVIYTKPIRRNPNRGGD
jgi:ribosomal protein S18 acetylase RimI-like enzyme